MANVAKAENVHTINYPYVFHGALMHRVDPDRPLADLVHEPPLVLDRDDSFPLHVGYAPSCVREYDLSGHGRPIHDCSCPWPHGHVLLQCDDGTALVPTPIASRAMVEKILDAWDAGGLNFSARELAEARRILSLVVGPLLPTELTKDEANLLASPGGTTEKFSILGWWS